MTPAQQEHAKYYKLLAAIIDPAVKEFNTGTIPQRQAAASFFRDEYNNWIWNAAGATVNDLIRCRLDGDPFDLASLKKARTVKSKSCRPAGKIKFNGLELTISEWADELNVTIGALKARLDTHGVRGRSFREMFR